MIRTGFRKDKKGRTELVIVIRYPQPELNEDCDKFVLVDDVFDSEISVGLGQYSLQVKLGVKAWAEVPQDIRRVMIGLQDKKKRRPKLR